MKFVGRCCAASVVLFVVVYGVSSSTTAAQGARETTQKSVGRGWPIPVALATFHGYPIDEFVGAVTPWYYQTSATATGGKAPANIQPLPHDIFTSKDFYVDRALWMDKRYYRCNSPIALDSMRLLLPAYRVRFVREGTAPLSLVYGRSDLDTPSYDLALLAPRLLGAPATELAAGPEQPVAPPAMNAMPMTVFWSILGLAVAVMLGLIARMVVKGGVPEAEPTEAEKKTA